MNINSILHRYKTAIFIAKNPLAINVWLRFAIRTSTQTEPLHEKKKTKQIARMKSNRMRKKNENYLCKQQTYQQIWIMQKLNLVHIIKVEQKRSGWTYCVSINTCFTARLQELTELGFRTDWFLCWWLFPFSLCMCISLFRLAGWQTPAGHSSCISTLFHSIHSFAYSLKTFLSVCFCWFRLSVENWRISIELNNILLMLILKVAQLKWLTLTLQLWLNWFYCSLRLRNLKYFRKSFFFIYIYKVNVSHTSIYIRRWYISMCKPDILQTQMSWIILAQLKI